MKNLKTFEGFLDKFRPNTSHPLPKPHEQYIEGRDIKFKNLQDLMYHTIRDSDAKLYMEIQHKYIEFFDVYTQNFICSFFGIPQPGETIDEDGNVVSEEEIKNHSGKLLHYDINGFDLEVYSTDDQDKTIPELTFSLKNAKDVTDDLIEEQNKLK